MISPSLPCPLSLLLLLTPFIAHLPVRPIGLPPAPLSLFLHHQSLPFLHGISAMQSRSCPHPWRPPLPIVGESLRQTPCAVFIQIATAPETQEMHLDRQRSGIQQPLGTLPRSIPPRARGAPVDSVHCGDILAWAESRRARSGYISGAVFGGEGENTML